MKHFLWKILFVGFFLMRVGNLSAKISESPAIYFGAPEDSSESRISLRGAVQPFPSSFVITPMIETPTRWFTARGAERSISYQEDFLPIPTIFWNFPDFRIEIKAFGWGGTEQAITLIRYRIINKAPRAIQGKIHFLLHPSDEKALRSLEFSEAAWSVIANGTQPILLSAKPEEAGFVSGGIKGLVSKMKRHETPQIFSVKAPEGDASGVLSYSFQLDQGEGQSWAMAVPLHPDGRSLGKIHFQKQLLEARSFWRKKTNAIEIQSSESNVGDDIRLQMANLLMLRDHPGIYRNDFKPSEAWTENALDAVEAYLDYGFLLEAREDLEMTALRVDGSGEIQARMISSGVEDPLRVYALQGKFVAAVWRYYLMSRDQTWLSSKWPLIKKVIENLRRLRAQRLTEWYSSGRKEKEIFYGILPPSMDPSRGDFRFLHRYEDDLWALRALNDAGAIASALGFLEEAKGLLHEVKALRQSFLNSMELTASKYNIRFIPETPETPLMRPWPGTTAVLDSSEAGYLPEERMSFHMRNLKELFLKLKDKDQLKAVLFSDFSVIRALLRKGDKQMAHQMLRFQKAQCGFGDVSQPSVFLRTYHDFFAYESSEKIILGAGILPEWVLGEKGLRVKLPTVFGEIRYSVRAVKNGWRIHVEGEANPSRGFIFHSPSGSEQQVFHRLPVDFELPSS